MKEINKERERKRCVSKIQWFSTGMPHTLGKVVGIPPIFEVGIYLIIDRCATKMSENPERVPRINKG